MIIWSSINCPTVIRLPTVFYFSREKALVKSTAPESLLYYICLHDLFLFAFIFRSIFPKTQKYLAEFYLLLFAFINLLQFLSHLLANFWRRYSKGIDNPFNTSGCEYLFFLLLFSDLLIQKPKNTLLQLLFIYFISRSREIYLSNLLQFLSRLLASFWRRYPKGIDNPFNTSGCEYLLFVCRCDVYYTTFFL